MDWIGLAALSAVEVAVGEPRLGTGGRAVAQRFRDGRSVASGGRGAERRKGKTHLAEEVAHQVDKEDVELSLGGALAEELAARIEQRADATQPIGICRPVRHRLPLVREDTSRGDGAFGVGVRGHVGERHDAAPDGGVVRDEEVEGLEDGRGIHQLSEGEAAERGWGKARGERVGREWDQRGRVG